MVQLTGSTGTLIKTYKYDAFGNEESPDPADNNPFRYCGEYFDRETVTIYLRARYYNPAIGRFITEDSYLGNNTDPLSLNLYTYCGNNPIMFIDPTGNYEETIKYLTYIKYWPNAKAFSTSGTYFMYYEHKSGNGKIYENYSFVYDIGTTLMLGGYAGYQSTKGCPILHQIAGTGMGVLNGLYKYATSMDAGSAAKAYKNRMEYVYDNLSQLSIYQLKNTAFQPKNGWFPKKTALKGA